MTRKTKAQRDAEFAASERQAWITFVETFERVATYLDAKVLVASAPAVDAPGRRYYSNLGFFLQQFSVPAGANAAERAMYLTFIRRIDEAGELKEGAREAIEAAFRAAPTPLSWR